MNLNGEQLTYKPIGIINSPHQEASKTPIQPVYSKGIQGTVIISPEYTDGLRDLDGFSYIYLIYHFHKAKDAKMVIKPFLQDEERGLFSTRYPARPNSIGISIVKLIEIENNILHIENVDILDGTPLLDIKPYTAKFDIVEDLKSGWQDEVDEDIAQIRGKREYNTRK
jgi:tRNA-Thr(GGU) m(6)t(6)A37 methyltransferase TsaA